MCFGARLLEAVAWGDQQGLKDWRGTLCGVHSPSPEATLGFEKCPLCPCESDVYCEAEAYCQGNSFQATGWGTGSRLLQPVEGGDVPAPGSTRLIGDNCEALARVLWGGPYTGGGGC